MVMVTSAHASVMVAHGLVAVKDDRFQQPDALLKPTRHEMTTRCWSASNHRCIPSVYGTYRAWGIYLISKAGRTGDIMPTRGTHDDRHATHPPRHRR